MSDGGCSGHLGSVRSRPGPSVGIPKRWSGPDSRQERRAYDSAGREHLRPVLSAPFARERLFRLRTFAAICDLIAESRCGCAGLVCGPSLRICRIVCPAVLRTPLVCFNSSDSPSCSYTVSVSCPVRMRFPYRLYFCSVCSVCSVPVLSCSCLVLSYPVPVLSCSRSILSRLYFALSCPVCSAFTVICAVCSPYRVIAFCRSAGRRNCGLCRGIRKKRTNRKGSSACMLPHLFLRKGSGPARLCRCGKISRRYSSSVSV